MKDTETHITHTPEETQAVAVQLVNALTMREHTRGSGTIVALSGELGAGKTTFTQGIAQALGISFRVTSPTYVLQKRYSLPERAVWKQLVHIDAYRLLGEEELVAVGWYDLSTNPHNMVVIEWPEQVGGAVPERAYEVRFEEVDEMTRRITVVYPDTQRHG